MHVCIQNDKRKDSISFSPCTPFLGLDELILLLSRYMTPFIVFCRLNAT